MTPVAIATANWHNLRAGLAGRRLQVYWAWVAHGPATTRELAARSGLPLLTVRPRTTELVNTGLVRLDGVAAGEGIYRPAARSEWETWRRAGLQTDAQMRLL